MNWVVLSASFSPASSWDDASDLGHNPAHLNETCTESSAWHGPHLYPSFALAVSSISELTADLPSNAAGCRISVPARSRKKGLSTISWQLGAFSDEGHLTTRSGKYGTGEAFRCTGHLW